MYFLAKPGYGKPFPIAVSLWKLSHPHPQRRVQNRRNTKLPSGSKLFQMLNPNTQGNDSSNSNTRLTAADFFLLHPVKSIP